MAEKLTIGALANLAGVNVETIRYYQRRGLIVEPDKPLGGIRSYQEADADRIRFIKSAQALGFTLDEIGLLLQLEDGTHCTAAGAIAEQKLAEVRARLKSLRRIEKALKGLIKQCHARRGKLSCPLIAALHGD